MSSIDFQINNFTNLKIYRLFIVTTQPLILSTTDRGNDRIGV